MKILVTADWQCSVTNLPQCEIIVEHLLELIPARKVDYLLILGDVKQSFNPVDLRVTNFLSNAVEKLVRKCPVYVLLGNHDRSTMRDDSQSCLPLLRTAGATVFEEPEYVQIGPKGKRIHASFVPFLRDKDRLRKHFKYIIDTSEFNLLLFHEEITGCKLNTKTKSTGGITLKDLKNDRYDLCLSGHIHFQQQAAWNVWYCGSPAVMDWGEVNQQKGFLLVDIETKKGGNWEVSPIPSRVPGWYDPSLPGFPKSNKDWKGAQIRIRVPKGTVTPTELDKIYAREVKKYPGANVQVTSHAVEEETETTTPLGENDTELLTDYLKQTVPLPQVERVLAYLQTRVQGKFSVGIKGFQIESVFAKETLSFKECCIQLNKPGLTLVTGVNKDWEGRANGVGKTNFLSLPQLALFGSTLKGQRHDSWRRNGSKDPTFLLLCGKLPEGSPVRIERGRKPGTLAFYVGDKNLTMGDANLTQKLIEETTGLTEEVFTNSIYIGQYEITTLLFGTDKQKKELFSRFLGLERFIKAQERVRADLLICNKFLSEIRTELAIAEVMVSEQQLALKSLQIATPKLEPPKQSSVDRNMIAAKEQELAAVLSWFDTNQENFEKYLDYEHAADAKIEQLQKVLDKMDEQPGMCPLCGASMKGAAREKHEKELKQEIAKAQEDSEKWYDIKLKNRTARANKALIEHQKRSELKALQEQLQKEEFAEKLWRQAQGSYLTAQQRVTEAQQRIFSIERKASAHRCYVEQLEHHVEFLQMCLKVVSRDGLPAYLCSKACPKLNKAAKHYSNLFTEDEIQIEFKMEYGELDLEIRNLHGGADVRDQSAGELRLAALTAVFAFRSVLVPIPLLILDEPSESLDSRNCVVFAKRLREVAQTFGTVFLTTHSVPLISVLEPDHHLEITKHNGISTVKELM